MTRPRAGATGGLALDHGVNASLILILVALRFEFLRREFFHQAIGQLKLCRRETYAVAFGYFVKVADLVGIKHRLQHETALGWPEEHELFLAVTDHLRQCDAAAFRQ